jgi:DNA-directed RNA polymerase beta subunit
MTRDQLVVAKEESTEFGGYFICNGIERIIRMLILQRRHYIMGLKRGAYLKRGANYTPWATVIRCVRPDQSSATVRLHYLADGGVNFAFTMRKAEYFIPVGLLLKCFVEVRAKRVVLVRNSIAWLDVCWHCLLRMHTTGCPLPSACSAGPVLLLVMGSCLQDSAFCPSVVQACMQ